MPGGRPDLGIQSTDTQHSGEDDARKCNNHVTDFKKKKKKTNFMIAKGGFKLAAFGVKQGGIGSLLAGGFPGLKKTPAKNTSPVKELREAATVPVAAAAPAAATTPAVAPVSPPAPTPAVAPIAPVAPVSPTTPATTNTPKAIVLHPYDAEGEDELSLLRGEYVDILDRHADEGWWKGRNERGLVGVFPVNFVRELEEESLAPPTPTRSRRSVQSNMETGSTTAAAPVIRPASVQAPVTTRPISVQAPAQRPSSISHTTTTTTNIVSPRISEQVKEEEEEETIEEEGTAEEEEEEEVVVKEKTITPVQSPVVAAEKPAQSPVIAQPAPAETPAQSPVISSEKSVATDEPVTEAVTGRDAVEPATEEEPAVQSPPVPARASSFSSEDSAKPLIEHVDQSSPVVVAEDAISDEEEKETDGIKEEEDACEKKEEKATETEKFDDLPTGGPKLTTPARARIGRARRSPQITSQEPSQTEILQKELSLQKEEEEVESTTPSPPAKPVKPIFAKFPTPFAVGGDVLSKAHLKPTQTRRLWEEKANEPAPSSSTTQEDSEPPATVRPSGVKNIASRFNFAGGNNSSGGNEVLETKLKNHTKNEVERVRKECEQLVNEEREKRVALEQIVKDLLERVKALEQ